MAKAVYIGNTNSKKVKKIYLGVNGTSRKVKKGYIGVNGSARLFYTSGYIWKRYTAISNYTYHWNRYDIKEVQDDDYSVQITSRHFYLKIRDAEDGNVQMFLCDTPPEIDRRGYFVTTGGWIYVSEDHVGETFCDYRTTSRVAYTINEAYETSDHDVIAYTTRYESLIGTHQEAGDFIDTVSSTSRNTYPDNDVSGDYWYVYDRSSVSYTQGSYVSDIESDDPNAYPSNGRHSDGYWYVLQPE